MLAPNEALGYLARWVWRWAGDGKGTGAGAAMTFKPLLPGQFEPAIFLGCGAKCLIK